ncbi:MAG TPA: transketolase C-terminal domain-containing protein [Thermoplasmata archaeon]|jgi:pyruvate/2-oxoacid:ferredoxin oxidoreductase alpha subunit|nr:transketolase C-terminal domain-containing protein [Thermoplasmata archaeon]
MPTVVMSGNSAQAYAAKLARVQVVSAYPITPQTSIVEKLADFVATGALQAEYVKVESEHSALQVVVSASGLGARVYTATSSHGLLLMHELVHWASGARDPIVMGVINRAVGPPWNIGADHTDSMSQRDTGWIQFYAESNQEVLDTVLMAYRLAEHPHIRLPVMVMEDAFYLSHTLEPVVVPDQEVVDKFLPPRDPHAILVPGTASRLGSFVGPDRYVDFRWEVGQAMERVPATLALVEEEYRRATGRYHGGPVVTYKADDADAVLITMGTSSTTARGVVDDLRAQGKKVGLAKLRLFRPFPNEEIRALAATADRIGVADRSYTFGPMGAAGTEVCAALYPTPHRPLVTGFYAGIGGRDVTPHVVRRMYETLLSGKTPEVHWADVEEEVAVDG